MTQEQKERKLWVSLLSFERRKRWRNKRGGREGTFVTRLAWLVLGAVIVVGSGGSGAAFDVEKVLAQDVDFDLLALQTLAQEVGVVFRKRTSERHME